MRVLVVGAEGFIGTALMKKLSDSSLFVLDADECVVVGHDIKSAEPLDFALMNLLKPTAIVNLAATLFGAAGLLADTEVAFKTAAWCAKENAPFFHASSVACGASDIEPWSYAERKVAQEKAIESVGFDSNSVTIARFHNVYGPDQPPGGLHGNMLAAAWSGEAVKVTGSGNQIRSWVHVNDVVAKIVEWIGAVVTPPKPGMTREVWEGVSLPVTQFIQSLEFLHKFELTVDYVEGDPGLLLPPDSGHGGWERLTVSHQLR